MTKLIVLGMLMLSLGGCTITDKIDGPVLDVYSRADVDAIQARSECRLLARTLVQIARCDGR